MVGEVCGDGQALVDAGGVGAETVVLVVGIQKAGLAAGDLVAEVVDGAGGGAVAVAVIGFQPVVLVIEGAVTGHQCQGMAGGRAIIDVIKDFGGFIIGGQAHQGGVAAAL